jgi:hypothetical protein
MEHNNDIPYYHSNISEINKSIYLLSQYLVKQYGISASDVIIDPDDNKINVTVDQVVWENPTISTKYKLGKFSDKYSLHYGNHYMLTIAEQIGNEEEIHIHVLDTQINDNGVTNYIRNVKVLKLTEENQTKRNEWWEANKKESNGLWLAIRPDTTDDIAHEGEFILHLLEQAETFINS